ncbi:ABC transporter permease [Streptomyces bacillaris]|uniref:ABC transporter permease n=1 Tax=Streptomyces bacillaris TaxID=68179 RepID=UPI0036F8A3A9
MFKTALRNVLAHKARLLMTMLAVTLGVAFVSGTLVFTDSAQKMLSAQSAKNFDKLSVVVRASQGHPADVASAQEPASVSQDAVDKIAAADGVATAVGRVSGVAGVGDKDGKLLGHSTTNQGRNIAPGTDPAYPMIQGAAPTGADQVAVDEGTVRKGGFAVGDTITVVAGGPAEQLTLTGVFRTEDPAVAGGASLVLFDTATAQKRYLKPGRFSSVEVTAKNGASQSALAEELRPLVGKDDEVITASALAADAEHRAAEASRSTATVLLGFAGIALFVGIFLIHNTFTTLVAQRTRELALMRAIGATRRQVMNSIAAEALLVGLLSSVLGLAAGFAMASLLPLLSSASSDGLLPAGTDMGLPVSAVITSLVVGVLVTLVAAWLPARRTSSIPPVAALGSVHLPASAKSLRLRIVLGSLLGAPGAGVVLLGTGAGGDLGLMLLAGGAFLLMTGLIVLLPAMSGQVISAVGPLLEKCAGVLGKLAVQNAVRNPRRTAVTAASLAVALALVTTFSVLGVSLAAALDKQTGISLKADYRISNLSGERVHASSVASLEKSPVVDAVLPDYSEAISYSEPLTASNGVTHLTMVVSGVDPETLGKVANVQVVQGSLDTLRQGQLAVSETEAEEYGLRVGSAVKVKDRTGARGTLTLGAVYQDLGSVLGRRLLSQDALTRYVESPTIEQVYVTVKGRASKATTKALRAALGKNPALAVQDREEIRNEAGGVISVLLNIMYGLLAIAVVISVLGVISTLAMAVHERTREIGILRAIGLDQARVKHMIRLESVVISLFGAVLGLTTGLFLAWAVGHVLPADMTTAYEMTLPYGRLALFLALAGAVGVFAAAWPARTAARLNTLEAIKTE